MKSKITHGGTGIVTREYEVRGIDQYGDAVEVFHFDTLRKARAAVAGVLETYPAAAIELATKKQPMHLFKNPVQFQTVATFGDKAALEAGGWLMPDDEGE